MLSTLSAAQQQQSQFSAPIDEAISGTTALTAPDTTTDQITPAFCQSLFNGSQIKLNFIKPFHTKT